MGTTIDRCELDKAASLLQNRWLTTLNRSAHGEYGWYRVLGRADRIGIVASAQGLISVESSPVFLRQREVLEWLIRAEMPNGGWPFISTLTDKPVVDATAWVLLAVVEYQADPSIADLNLSALASRISQTLLSMALVSGGWGLTANGTFRSYSSSLVILALCAAGEYNRPEVRRALTLLLDQRDAQTGMWFDAQRRLSIPVSSIAVDALLAFSRKSGMDFSQVISRCLVWVSGVAHSSNFWLASRETPSAEEVENESGAQLSRVEYKYSVRPSATKMLLRESLVYPSSLHGLRQILDGLADDNWHEISGSVDTADKSWALFDVMECLAVARSTVPIGGQVWTNSKRVVLLAQNQNLLVRFFKVQWPRLLAVACFVGLCFILYQGGILEGLNVKSILAVVGSVFLGVLTNWISEYFMRPKVN